MRMREKSADSVQGRWRSMRARRTGAVMTPIYATSRPRPCGDPACDSGDHVIAMDDLYGGSYRSVLLKGGTQAAIRMCERTELLALAESLGGVESLINHPSIMTHASVPADIRARLGSHDHLVRLSVGVECMDDLKTDLQTALA